MPLELTTMGHQFVAANEAKTAKGKKALTAASAELAAVNGNRIGLYVSNPSSKEVWLALGPTATKEEGIWLKKESGSIYIAGYGGVVSGVTTEGEGVVAFSEV